MPKVFSFTPEVFPLEQLFSVLQLHQTAPARCQEPVFLDVAAVPEEG